MIFTEILNTDPWNLDQTISSKQMFFLFLGLFRNIFYFLVLGSRFSSNLLVLVKLVSYTTTEALITDWKE